MIPLHLLTKTPLPTPLLRPFQRGAVVQVEVGHDLLTFLTKELGMNEDGIAKIQTIFWQSKPVDDIAACVIRDGGVLALSAALPGLVGASLRRGGAWSALRDTISHQRGDGEEALKPGSITVKLFNFMLSEVGPLLLNRGIVMQPAELLELVTAPPVHNQLVRVTADNREIPLESLDSVLLGDLPFLLTVETKAS